MTGIILSGGKNLRMGENKAFIEIDGLPIIQRILNLFEELFQEIIIVTNQKELFSNLKSKIYSDLFPNKGALGGLYTGLYFATHPYSFCVGCDMPFIKKPLVQFLMKQINGRDAIVPHTQDGLQPLHAIYSKNCLIPIKKTMDEGKYKIVDFLSLINVRILEEDAFINIDPMKESFININTPEELMAIRNKKRVKINEI